MASYKLSLKRSVEKDLRSLSKESSTTWLSRYIERSRRLTVGCRQLLKRHDEFGYLNEEDFGISFDSKENFDKNFHGSWFNYYR